MVDDSESSDESLGGFSSVNDANDDPFSFQQRKFIGNKKPFRKPPPSSEGDDDSRMSDSSTSSSSPPPKARGRRSNKKAAAKGRNKPNGKKDVDKKLELLSRRRANAMKKRQRSSIDLDSSSSSSSEDDKENRKKAAGRRSVGRGNGSKPTTVCIDLSSDSSEDENDKPCPSLASNTSSSSTRRMTRTAARAAAAAASLDKGSPSKRKKSDLKDASKDTVDALKEARQAMEGLKKAQKYKAEDVSFELDEDDNDALCVDGESVTNSSFQAQTTKASSGMPTSLSEAPTGVLIRLNIRITLTARNKKKSDGGTVMCKIRTGEKLQRVVDQLSESTNHSISASSDVKLSFDGQNLNFDKTPLFYDMEDEDLVDAIVQASAASGSGKVSASSRSQNSLGARSNDASAASEARVKIRTRIQGGDPRKVYEFLMRKADPLFKLIDAYGKQHRKSGVLQSTASVHLEYNGRRLNSSSTPQSEGIVDNTLLEINDEAERQLQLRQVPQDSASSLKPGQISLKCRINGDDKKMQTYGMLSSDVFRVLVTEFCSRNGLVNTDCTFKFEGERLRQNQTPSQLDLEGEEIIEVLVAERVLAAARTVASSGIPRESSHEAAPSPVIPPSTRPRRLASSSVLNGSFTPSESRSLLGSTSLRSTSSSTTHHTVLSLQIMRNNDSKKLKKFKLYSVDKLQKLKEGYKKYYKKKGCRSVEFYFHGVKLTDTAATLESLGFKDMDVIVAVENGRKFTAS